MLKMFSVLHNCTCRIFAIIVSWTFHLISEGKIPSRLYHLLISATDFINGTELELENESQVMRTSLEKSKLFRFYISTAVRIGCFACCEWLKD